MATAETTSSLIDAGTGRRKHNYCLHDPDTMEPIGSFVGRTFREPAMKAATAGHTKIYLRRKNSSIVHMYDGSIVDIDPPAVVERKSADGTVKEVKHYKKPHVKRVGKFVYEPPKKEDDTQTSADTQSS